MKPDNPPATNTTADTHSYQIESTTTGRIFGEYEASSSRKARDVFAQDAGYDDYEDLLEQVPRSEMADIKVSRTDR